MSGITIDRLARGRSALLTVHLWAVAVGVVDETVRFAGGSVDLGFITSSNFGRLILVVPISLALTLSCYAALKPMARSMVISLNSEENPDATVSREVGLQGRVFMIQRSDPVWVRFLLTLPTALLLGGVAVVALALLLDASGSTIGVLAVSSPALSTAVWAWLSRALWGNRSSQRQITLERSSQEQSSC